MPPKKASANTVSFTTADGRKVCFQRDPTKKKEKKEKEPEPDSQYDPENNSGEGGPQTKRPTDLRPVLVLQDDRPHQLSQHASKTDPAKRP